MLILTFQTNCLWLLIHSLWKSLWALKVSSESESSMFLPVTWAILCLCWAMNSALSPGWTKAAIGSPRTLLSTLSKPFLSVRFYWGCWFLEAFFSMLFCSLFLRPLVLPMRPCTLSRMISNRSAEETAAQNTLSGNGSEQVHPYKVVGYETVISESGMSESAWWIKTLCKLRSLFLISVKFFLTTGSSR